MYHELCSCTGESTPVPQPGRSQLSHVCLLSPSEDQAESSHTRHPFNSIVIPQHMQITKSCFQHRVLSVVVTAHTH